MLDVMQQFGAIGVGILLVAILLKILISVHRQNNRVSELESQLKTIESANEAAAKEENNNG